MIATGTGNNAGDGFALGRMLHLKGYHVDFVSVLDFNEASNLNKVSVETKRQADIIKKYGLHIYSDIPCKSYGCVVDSLFGTGLSRPIEGKYKDLLEKLNDIDAYKVSIDIPSGIHSDTGKVLGTHFRADLTVTMAFPKYGHLYYPGREYTGELVVADIGVTKESFLGEDPKGRLYEKKDIAKILPQRLPDTHKGSYGRVLCIAGSKDMAGACFLCAKSAYASGAGLVCVYTPEENRVIIQEKIPEAIVYTYNDFDEAGLRKAIDKATVVILGPGFGTDILQSKITEYVLKYSQRPLILDADGINIVSNDNSLRELLKNYKGKKILTPHIKEASKLSGKDIPKIKEDPVLAAEELSDEYGADIVLKDAVSTIARTDGKIFINNSGNNAMAKGGSGDVLSGIIGGFVSSGMDSSDAASFGPYIHGLCGDAARQRKGAYSVLASDIIDGMEYVGKSVYDEGK